MIFYFVNLSKIKDSTLADIITRGIHIIIRLDRYYIYSCVFSKEKKLWANFVQESDMETLYEAINSFSP